MTLSLDDCRAIAEQTRPDQTVLHPDPLHAGAYGWVFGYQGIEFVETGVLKDMLFGNAPLLVDKRSGEVFELGTAHSVEVYVSNYQRCGNPHKSPGSRVELVALGNLDDLSCITMLRKLGMSVSAAKQAVDAVSTGRTTIIECASRDAAETFATVILTSDGKVTHLCDQLTAP